MALNTRHSFVLAAIGLSVIAAVCVERFCLLESRVDYSVRSEYSVIAPAYGSIQSGMLLDHAESVIGIPAGLIEWNRSDNVIVIDEVHWERDTAVSRFKDYEFPSNRFNYYHGDHFGIFVYYGADSKLVIGKKLVLVRRAPCQNKIAAIFREFVESLAVPPVSKW